MSNIAEIVLLSLVLVLALFVLLPSDSCNKKNSSEGFTSVQKMESSRSSVNYDPVSGNDFTSGSQFGNDVNNAEASPAGDLKNFESLIYDNVTGTIMTGSQFMENSGIVAPPWVSPAWAPDAFGPSSKGKFIPEDYEDDSRMLYNKCSLSCCSPQYPTPFQGVQDPTVCDEEGNNKYLASDYICQNNTGGVGCLCMSQKQVDGMKTGFSDYYVDKNNLGY